MLYYVVCLKSGIMLGPYNSYEQANIDHESLIEETMIIESMSTIRHSLPPN